MSSSLPFEPKYRSLGFDGHDFSAPHHDAFHSLNQEADRSMGGGTDLAMPAFRPTSHSPMVNPLNPKVGSSDWGVEADYPMPSLKGLKNLPPVAMGSQNQVYRAQKTTSALQQGLEAVSSAPAPSELPTQFEMYSSFWSSSSPAEIWPAVLKTLQANPKVDFIFQAKRNKVKGTIIQNNYSVQFNVRIFSKPTKDSAKWNANAKHLVEIQRRSGDAFEFNAFYKQTVDAICKTDKTVFLADASPVVQKQLPVGSGSSLAPPSLQSKSEITLDAETRRALYSMAVAAQNTEAQREALRTLASISTTVNATNFLTSQDREDGLSKLSLSDDEITLEQVLHCALTSRDYEVRRCASTLLANISRQESAQPIMSSTLIQKMFALLEQGHLDNDLSEKPETKPLPDYMAAETKRQIAKAISGLSAIPTSCKIMASQPDYVRLLRQQSDAADPRLTIYAESAVARMAPQLGMGREIFV